MLSVFLTTALGACPAPDVPASLAPLGYNPFLAFPPVKAAGEGGLVCGHYYRTTQPLQLWRTYQSRVPSSRIRRWWNFVPPFAGESVAEWRVLDDVCRDWTPHPDYYHSCVLPAGVPVAVGPGQSANCNGVFYPVSSLLQVYVDDYSAFAECGTPHKLGTGIGKDDTQFASSGLDRTLGIAIGVPLGVAYVAVHTRGWLSL